MTTLLEIAERLARIGEEYARVVSELAVAAAEAAPPAEVRALPVAAPNRWLSTEEAAELVGRTRGRVSAAAAAGLLHGHQRMPKGKWMIHRAAVEAWAQGADELVQAHACGCVHLPQLRKR